MQQIETELLQIDAFQPQQQLIQRAATLIQQGKLVVFPTETVYGLGGNAFELSAVTDIFVAKERPYSDPLIVHIAEFAQLEQLVTTLPIEARKLAEAFWPGPLTLVLPAHPRVPRQVTAGMETVAIRMPRHAVALALIRAADVPIAAPSANRFMHVSPTTAQHAFADLHGRVPLILDAGPCEVGVESTVLDLCTETPTILRPGGASLEALRAVLPTVQPPQSRATRASTQHESGTPRSPGQMLIHYAPAMSAWLFTGSEAYIRANMLAEIQRRQAQGERVGLLIAEEDVTTFQQSGAALYILGSTRAPETVAARLFAGLRTLEESGVGVIFCRDFAQEGIGLAIHDRLMKATGGNVIPS